MKTTKEDIEEIMWGVIIGQLIVFCLVLFDIFF